MGLNTVAGTVAILAVIRLGLGAFGSPIFPTFAMMIANWIPAGNRALVYGLIAAGAPLGGAISPVLFSWMIVQYGWRASFVQVGLVIAILAVASFWYLRDHPSQHPLVGERGARLLLGENDAFSPERRAPIPWRELFTNHNLLLLASWYFTLGYFQYLLYYWTFYYLSEIRHIGQTASALGTMSTFLAAMCMTPAGGWISDRLCQRYGEKRGRPIVPVIGLLSGALFLSLATKTSSLILVFAMVSLALGLGSAAESPYWASAIHIGGREVGATCGITNSSGNLGGLLAPVLTPLIASYVSWSWGLYAGRAIAPLGVLICIAVDPTARLVWIDASRPSAQQAQNKPEAEKRKPLRETR
jgi:MFS family permease